MRLQLISGLECEGHHPPYGGERSNRLGGEEEPGGKRGVAWLASILRERTPEDLVGGSETLELHPHSTG